MAERRGFLSRRQIRFALKAERFRESYVFNGLRETWRSRIILGLPSQIERFPASGPV
jgi:hypothetical protein